MARGSPAKDDASATTGIECDGWVGEMKINGWESEQMRSPFGVRAICSVVGRMRKTFARYHDEEPAVKISSRDAFSIVYTPVRKYSAGQITLTQSGIQLPTISAA